MAEFMTQHPQLAKNILPNCGQGRAVTNKLWEQLGNKLNRAGPPIKDVKSWRKASIFTDWLMFLMLHMKSCPLLLCSYAHTYVYTFFIYKYVLMDWIVFHVQH